MPASKELEQFYADVVTTSAEDRHWPSWAVEVYHWCDEDYTSTDPEMKLQPNGGGNARAVVVIFDDAGNPEYTEAGDLHEKVIDTKLMVRAFSNLRKGGDKCEGLSESNRSRILDAWTRRDAGDIDADDAQWIVQIGWWGEVKYS